MNGYEWDTRIAYAVCMAESGGHPDAIGDQSLTFYDEGRLVGMSCGLMQVRVLKGRPGCNALLDPQTNMEWAWRIYQAGGWKPWTGYTSGKYKEYL